jgi:predicted S18 family serine protease
MLNNGTVEVCLKEDVDKVLAEKDREIALLKERICNGDVSRLTWIDDCIAKDKEIAELKAALEDAKATAYAESVDAGMRERRLKRALWLARAERAEAEHAHWATIWFCNTKIALNINKSSVSNDPYKSNTFRNASEWRNMWYDIASKCRAKAEEY